MRTSLPDIGQCDTENAGQWTLLPSYEWARHLTRGVSRRWKRSAAHPGSAWTCYHVTEWRGKTPQVDSLPRPSAPFGLWTLPPGYLEALPVATPLQAHHVPESWPGKVADRQEGALGLGTIQHLLPDLRGEPLVHFENCSPIIFRDLGGMDGHIS